jgi:hypothetical protein
LDLSASEDSDYISSGKAADSFSNDKVPYDEMGFNLPAFLKLCAGIINIVGAAVSSLDTSNLVEMAQKLVELRTRYGIQRKHFDVLGKALDCALRDVLKESFTTQAKREWSTAYSSVSVAVMQKLSEVQVSGELRSPTSPTCTPASVRTLGGA